MCKKVFDQRCGYRRNLIPDHVRHLHRQFKATVPEAAIAAAAALIALWRSSSPSTTSTGNGYS